MQRIRRHKWSKKRSHEIPPRQRPPTKYASIKTQQRKISDRKTQRGTARIIKGSISASWIWKVPSSPFNGLLCVSRYRLPAPGHLPGEARLQIRRHYMGGRLSRTSRASPCCLSAGENRKPGSRWAISRARISLSVREWCDRKVARWFCWRLDC